MSQGTKNRIADALESLLQKNSISKVTVSDIIAASGVSRQTFYNNFVDIYDLVYWTHAMRIKEAVDTFWEEQDFCQAFETAMVIMRKHKVFYEQIVRKEGVNSFQRLFAQQNVELSKIRIQKVSECETDARIDFLLELYWYGASQMLVDWIMEGMKKEPRELSELLYEGLPMKLRPYWPQ